MDVWAKLSGLNIYYRPLRAFWLIRVFLDFSGSPSRSTRNFPHRRKILIKKGKVETRVLVCAGKLNTCKLSSIQSLEGMYSITQRPECGIHYGIRKLGGVFDFKGWLKSLDLSLSVIWEIEVQAINLILAFGVVHTYEKSWQLSGIDTNIRILSIFTSIFADIYI